MKETITDQVIKQGSAMQLNSDYNNCTVLALSATTGMSYDKAFQIAQNEWDRQYKKGVRTLTLLEYFKSFAEKISTKRLYHTKKSNKTVECKITVGSFAKDYPIGNYFVLVSGHALAINDGKILDHSNFMSKTKRIVKHAWKIK